MWEAVALSLNIEPDKIKADGDAWMGANHPFDEGDEFSDRLAVLLANTSNKAYFPSPCVLSMEAPYKCGIKLAEFSAWAKSVARWDIPPELAELASPIDALLTGHGKRWNIRVLTQEAAEDWLRKPCWSMSEALFLLNGIEVEGYNTCDSPPNVASGKDADWLRRAQTSQQLIPVGHDKNGEAAFSPRDVIQVAETGNIGCWRIWKSLLGLPEYAVSQDESKEQRQARRYQMCVDAQLNMPDNDYATLPRGIGKLAEREGISRQAFSEDVKAHIARMSERKKQLSNGR